MQIMSNYYQNIVIPPKKSRLSIWTFFITTLKSISTPYPRNKFKNEIHCVK